MSNKKESKSGPSTLGVIGMIAVAGITIGASLLMDKVFDDQHKKKEKKEPEAIEQQDPQQQEESKD